jgi:hypothetical protein
MHDEYPVAIDEKTGAEGRFAIEGIPETDVRLYYGSQWPSPERVPYSVIYYQDPASPSSTGILRLRVGEQRTGIILRLPAPLKVIVLRVRVVRPGGSPVRGAFVDARFNAIYTESVKTGPAGTAELPCLEGLEYQLEAHIFAGHRPDSGVMRNQPVPMVCGKNAGPFALTLDRVARH